MSADPCPQTLRLEECAVVVHAGDNTAVARRGLLAGMVIEGPGGKPMTLTGDVTPGNRFAIVPVGKGEYVRQYGQPIGTSLGILAGDPITRRNMSDDVPVVRDLPPDLATPAPALVPEAERATFMGYRRADGRVGTRNWILIVPTSTCASHEARQIAMRAEYELLASPAWAPLRSRIDGVVAIPHNRGCGCPDGTDVDTVLRVLANYADHPNVGAALFLDLGCEKTNIRAMEEHLGAKIGKGFGKPTAWIGIQPSGGTKAAIEAGLRQVEKMLPVVGQSRRESVPVSELVLGVECGSSDGFSGISANPALGRAADLVVGNGGTVILSEVPEWCGAEHVLALRAKDADTGRRVYEFVDWYKKRAARSGATLGENPSPGNVAGGLLNITIKSLGAISKGGSTRIEGCIDYGARAAGRGLQLMQGPGYDPESVPGLVASGATAVVFTTGRGTTLGNAIVPVIKLASNSGLIERMPHDIDLSAGGIIDGTETIEAVGARVFEHVRRVSGGEVRALAEENEHREFQIWAPEALSL